MENQPATAAREGAFLALALADALSLGLPDPDYITVSPSLARSTTTSAIDFQFNDQHEQAPLPAMHAWAARFGATIRTETDDPSKTWHGFDFRHAGVMFYAYAAIMAACAAVAEHTGVACSLPPGHDGRHEHHLDGRPSIVWGPGVTEPDDASALARSIEAGTPVIIEEDLPDCAHCGHPETAHFIGDGSPIATGACDHCDGCTAYTLPQEDVEPDEAAVLAAGELAADEVATARDRERRSDSAVTGAQWTAENPPPFSRDLSGDLMAVSGLAALYPTHDGQGFTDEVEFLESDAHRA